MIYVQVFLYTSLANDAAQKRRDQAHSHNNPLTATRLPTFRPAVLILGACFKCLGIDPPQKKRRSGRWDVHEMVHRGIMKKNERHRLTRISGRSKGQA
jgi:hypothetical protein